jgi:hypothetical protein
MVMRFKASTFRGGGSQFEDALVNATRPIVRTAAERCGAEAQNRILANIDATTGKRQGKARSEPLLDAARYPYEVISSTRLVRLVFKVSGSAAFKAKFGSLNYGSVEHEISPVNAQALGNPQYRSARYPNGFFSRGTVVHPGNPVGRRFFEDGIEEAVDQFATFL